MGVEQPTTLNTDQGQRVTTGEFADPGDGTARWYHWMRLLNGLPHYPTGATPVAASSGNVANAAAVATLPATASVTNYITGFEITGAGSTAGLNVIVTVAGILGGTLSFIFTAPTGVLVPAPSLVVAFPAPIPASAVNTAIVVTCPALGAGNTHAAATAHGFRI